MVIRNLKLSVIFLFASICILTASAQLNSTVLQQYLRNLPNNTSQINDKEEIEEFYAFTEYQTTWLQKDTTNLATLFDHLSAASN